MQHANRLSKLIKLSSKLPLGLRTKLWNRSFGHVVPMVGTAKIHYITVQPHQVTVQLKNHKSMQNHIGQLHACAMALLAETATGFVCAMHVPDHAVLLIKQMHIDYKRPSKGTMTATAILTLEQQQLLQSTLQGETLVEVTVQDETGAEPIVCKMLWAWRPKKINT